MPPACSLLLWDGGEGITLNQLLSLFSSILKGEKSGAGFATLISLHPSLLLSMLTSCPGCSLDYFALPSGLSTEPSLGCLGMLEMVCFLLKLGPSC